MLQHIVFDLGAGCPILKFGHIHIFQRELNPNLFRVDLALGKQGNRLLVGTLLEIGRGRWEPEYVLDLLAARDRKLAGPTAPPEGLCLMKVDY